MTTSTPSHNLKEVLDVMIYYMEHEDADTETLIHDILSYYENGTEGTPPVPEKLLNANAYNREIMELLKTIAIENASVSSVKNL